AGKENCEIMGSYAKKVVPVVVGNGLKSYTKLLSSSAGVARIKFAVPINPADLNSENIKYCIQRVGSQSCDIDPTGQYNFSFRYNPVSRILVVKVTNLTTLEKKKGLGPFKLGRILGFGGLKLNKINDSDSNLLAEMNVLVK
ncbi:MAG: hypothetical protein NT041_01715, partial [Candidatus Vogelbacteria bacterium]|nr:hypothetical protein [Candidatus Vogelbacteria bacterium]